MRRFLLRLLTFFRTGHAEAELAREIEAHLQLLEEGFIAKGMSADEARYAARRAFGGVEQAKERQRDERSFGSIDAWWLDVKLGARIAGKYPGLSIVGGLGMAVAIAIGAVVFTMLYGHLRPVLPLDEGERVVAIENRDVAANTTEPRSLHDFAAWRRQLTSMEALGAFRTVDRNLAIPGGQTELLPIAEMTASGFRVARVPPSLGRPLADADERDGAPPVVVIGYELWRTHFASDPAVIGRTIRLGATPHTIVGVMPERFAFPVNHRVWVPLRANPANYERRQGPSIEIFGRLAPGATRQSAQAELSAIGLRTAAEFPKTHAQLRPRIVTYTAKHSVLLVGDLARWQLDMFQSAVTLLLVLVCANVAVLVYARTATRGGELAIRTALGASRRRIVAQLFVEALVLAACAAMLGLALAVFGMRQIDDRIAAAGRLAFWIEPGLSFASIVYVAGLTILAAAIAGVIPAIQATGRTLATGLRELGGATGLRLGATWTALIVVQVAFAVAVLPTVAYQGAQLIPYTAIDPGFPAEHYLTASLRMERDVAQAASAPAYQRAFTARYADRQIELANRLRAEPGVGDVTFAMGVPGAERTVWIAIEGVAPPASTLSNFAVRSGTFGHEVRFTRVDAGYFGTFDVPLAGGRRFVDADLNPSGDTAIVNRSFVRDLLADGNAIGRRFKYVGRSGDARPQDVTMDRWYEIVGVVDDFPVHELQPGYVAGKVYQPLPGGQSYPATLIVRLRGTTPAGFAPRMREITAGLDPTLQLDELLPLDAVLNEERGIIRLGALTMTLVIVSVLMLSAAGIYALIAFTVTQRRREIAIRLALGADRRHIVGSIFSRALGQLLIGVAAGLAAAALLDRLADGDLLGGEAGVILPAVSMLMIAVGLLAAVGPARRGLRIQPTDALKSDG